MNRSEELKNHLARIGEGINRKFQPPASPPWGGVHESLVKSVKIALNCTLNPKGGQKRRNPTDLQLSALFAEVERFVNSRPITYISSDPQDIETLAPYHFWLHRRSPVIPLGEYSQPNFQDRFKKTQHLTNVVWQQLVKLYLPSLISRKKWQNEDIVFLAKTFQEQLQKQQNVLEATSHLKAIIRETYGYIWLIESRSEANICKQCVPVSQTKGYPLKPSASAAHCHWSLNV